MITLKVNMTTNQNYYSQTLIVTKILAAITVSLISVIIRLSQNTITETS